uniref:SH2 domain-containing protein n=1 Tax=Ditylenchus dipsaci TaxID=166011 RepID=A0A915EI14_9BILA
MDHDLCTVETVRQLQSSGIQFSIEFVGSLTVHTSMNVIPADAQDNLAFSCMRLVAKEAKYPNCQVFQSDNNIFEHIHDEQPDIFNNTVDINISSKAILLVESNECNMQKILHRFDIHDISLVSPGKDELSSFFCFFAKAKVKDGDEMARKCFVFDAHTEMEEVREIICYAFRLNEDEEEGTSSKPVISEQSNQRRVPMPDCNMLSPDSARSQCNFGGVGSPTPQIRIEPVRPAPPPPTSPLPPPPPPTSLPPQLPPRSRKSTFSSSIQSNHNDSRDSINTLHSNNTSCSGGEPSDRFLGCNSHQHRGSSPASHDDKRARSHSRDMTVEVSKQRYREITAELASCPWYHGLLSRAVAESLLCRDGQFLVRQSPNIADQFVLSGVHNQQFKHICLVSHEGKVS